MYTIIEAVINSRNYELSDILKKIDTIWLQGGISDEEKNSLIAKAQENADGEQSYLPLQEQINKLFTIIDSISDRVTILEGGEAAITEEYPEFVQPSGKHDAYNKGDKITYNGKKYECVKNNVMWSPDVNPKYWKEVTEDDI